MIAYPFTYRRAQSVKDAEAMLAHTPDAKLLAGGHSLIPAMKLRLANPSALIDISGLPELSYIRGRDGGVAIGAMTTHSEVMDSDLVHHRIPALAHLVSEIGDPAVRHLGTIGGSVANNDPAADYPAAVLGLGATVTTTRRSIAADVFFTGMFATALDEGEIVTEIFFPVPKRAGYAKFANPASRYAMVGVFVADTEAGIRVAVTGAAGCVFRAQKMEAALADAFSPEAVGYISVSADGLNSDIHGSAEYRAHLVTVMAKRAVTAALES